jgi:hypothetical protein
MFNDALGSRSAGLKQLANYVETKVVKVTLPTTRPDAVRLAGQLQTIHDEIKTKYEPMQEKEWMSNFAKGDPKERERAKQRLRTLKLLGEIRTAVFDLANYFRTHNRNLDTTADMRDGYIGVIKGKVAVVRGYAAELDTLIKMPISTSTAAFPGGDNVYIATLMPIKSLLTQVKDPFMEQAVRWACGGKEGKIRFSSHGDGKGNVFMGDDYVPAENIAKWLWLHNASAPTGQQKTLARPGVKGKDGLTTIALSSCMGGRFTDESNNSTPGPLVDGNGGKYTDAAPGSAIDKIAQEMRKKHGMLLGLTGIEITGSNEVVREEGGKWGIVNPADFSWAPLIHQPIKVRVIT